jgi:hypothetical protein
MNKMTDVPSSKLMTKKWRKEQSWYKGGKRNECEKIQKSWFKEITGLETAQTKTNIRHNMMTGELMKSKLANKKVSPFEITEDYDLIINDIYVNFKFIADQGGAQFSRLQCAYFFIKAQITYLTNNQNTNKVFVNILDGDFCYSHRENLPKYKSDNFFIGDTNEFSVWWKIHNSGLSNK